MGEKIVEKIIITTKSEMNSTLPPNSHTSIRYVSPSKTCLKKEVLIFIFYIAVPPTSFMQPTAFVSRLRLSRILLKCARKEGRGKPYDWVSDTWKKIRCWSPYSSSPKKILGSRVSSPVASIVLYRPRVENQGSGATRSLCSGVSRRLFSTRLSSRPRKTPRTRTWGSNVKISSLLFR